MATASPASILQATQNLGQSLWLDNISRSLITSGKLARLINEDGLQGMTSNPAIFDKAFSEGTEYDADIRTLARQHASTHCRGQHEIAGAVVGVYVTKVRITQVRTAKQRL